MKVYLRIFFLMLGDYISFMGIFILTAYLYQLCGGEYELITYLKMWPFGLLFILINEISRLYHGTIFYPGASLGPVEELRRMFYSVTSVFCGLLLFLFIRANFKTIGFFLLKFHFSRIKITWTRPMRLFLENSAKILVFVY